MGNSDHQPNPVFNALLMLAYSLRRRKQRFFFRTLNVSSGTRNTDFVRVRKWYSDAAVLNLQTKGHWALQEEQTLVPVVGMSLG